jgi:hypothetical protein
MLLKAAGLRLFHIAVEEIGLRQCFMFCKPGKGQPLKRLHGVIQLLINDGLIHAGPQGLSSSYPKQKRSPTAHLSMYHEYSDTMIDHATLCNIMFI